MNNRAKKPYLFCLIALPIIAAASITLRTVALLIGYEADIGRYENGTLSLINGLLLLVLAGALALFAHEMKEMLAFRPNYRDLPTLFSGVFAAITLILFGITLPIGLTRGVNLYAAILAVFSGVMALGGAAVFVLRAFDGKARGGHFALLNLPLSVLGVSYPLYLSFAGHLRIGDPAASMATVTWILIALFFLGEARIALDRAKWALHTYVTVLTVIFSATLSLPNLVYHIARGAAILGNSEQDFVVLAILLYAMARLFAVFRTVVHEGSATTRFAMGMSDEATNTDATE